MVGVCVCVGGGGCRSARLVRRSPTRFGVVGKAIISALVRVRSSNSVHRVVCVCEVVNDDGSEPSIRHRRHRRPRAPAERPRREAPASAARRLRRRRRRRA